MITNAPKSRILHLSFLSLSFFKATTMTIEKNKKTYKKKTGSAIPVIGTKKRSRINQIKRKSRILLSHWNIAKHLTLT